MKKYPVLVLALGITLGFIVFFIMKGNTAQEFKTMHVGTADIRVELADTDAKRTQGLSDRPLLAKDAGMLFTFDKPATYAFWMKDMHFPLDFVYFNNFKIVEVKENVPATDLTPFSPSEPVDAVLEVNAGFIQRNGVAVGQVVVY